MYQFAEKKNSTSMIISGTLTLAKALSAGYSKSDTVLKYQIWFLRPWLQSFNAVRLRHTSVVCYWLRSCVEHNVMIIVYPKVGLQ